MRKSNERGPKQENQQAKAQFFSSLLVSGWRINGITVLRSGVPIALIAAANGLSQFGAGTIRPDYVRGCSKRGPGSPHSAARANKWFNTSCFGQPAYFSFGDEPRVDPFLRSEGQVNFDTAVSKTFAPTEQTKLRFSAEIFDLFNHAQFAEPISDLSSPAFGQVQSQTNLPRTIQLAARFTF